MDISLLDLKHAFLAGLVEGDCCIILRAHKDTRKSKGVAFGMYLKVSNTKKELIDFLGDNYGGNVSPGWQPKGRKSFMYEWTMYGNKAKSLLSRIYPYLVSKKKQAELAVRFQDLLNTSVGVSYSQADYNERTEMVKEMHNLNAKGGDVKWLNL